MNVVSPAAPKEEGKQEKKKKARAWGRAEFARYHY